MNKTKTIAIDARFYDVAGPGRYTKSIIDHLQDIDKSNNYIIFLRKKGFDNFNPTNNNFKKVLADFPWYSFSEQTLFLFKILKHNPDLLYVPHFNIPILYPKKIVTAIPDLIMHSFSTQAGTTLPKPYFLFKKFVYKLVVLIAVLRTYKNICPSNDVKNDFIKHYPFVNKDKFLVSYEGIDKDLLVKPSKEFASKTLKELKIKEKEPFLLYVSSMYEHKNVKRLIDGFEILKNEFNFKGQLVIIGKKDNFSIKIKQYIKEKGLTKNILMPGLTKFVTDEQVNALRTTASVYVFPSLKEGFSLTPLEAQYYGVPCVISDIGCHKEIYGNSVLYFDPLSPKNMSSKINLMLTDKQMQKDFVKRGFDNVKKYNWNDTAKDTLKVFNDALK